MHEAGCVPDARWRQGRLAVEWRFETALEDKERGEDASTHTGQSAPTAAELREFSGRLQSDIITLQRKVNIASELDHTLAEPPHHHLRPLPANS
jgi:hypothetical protein